MTTIEYNDTPLELPRRRTGWLHNWFRAIRRRRMERVTLDELQGMNPHLLRDMGIAPQDVIDALEGRNSSALFEPMRRPDRE